jgi:hypothetical protein
MNIRENAVSDFASPAAADTREARLERLLAAVVAACRCLVEHGDLQAGLQAAVEQLGRLSGHDRACVWQLVEQQQVCVCIAEWNAPGIGSWAGTAGAARFRVADSAEV